MIRSENFIGAMQDLFGVNRQDASDMQEDLDQIQSSRGLALDSPDDQTWEGGMRVAARVGKIALGAIAIAFAPKILPAILIPLLGPELAPIIGLALVAIALLAYFRSGAELARQVKAYLSESISGPIAHILEF